MRAQVLLAALTVVTAVLAAALPLAYGQGEARILTCSIGLVCHIIYSTIESDEINKYKDQLKTSTHHFDVEAGVIIFLKRKNLVCQNRLLFTLVCCLQKKLCPARGHAATSAARAPG